jgi:hypothetical protein
MVFWFPLLLEVHVCLETGSEITFVLSKTFLFRLEGWPGVRLRGAVLFSRNSVYHGDTRAPERARDRPGAPAVPTPAFLPWNPGPAMTATRRSGQCYRYWLWAHRGRIPRLHLLTHRAGNVTVPLHHHKYRDLTTAAQKRRTAERIAITPARAPVHARTHTHTYTHLQNMHVY